MGLFETIDNSVSAIIYDLIKKQTLKMQIANLLQKIVDTNIKLSYMTGIHITTLFVCEKIYFIFKHAYLKN